jgi:predicted  nucleic acid-binding Zn-ribbon protein
LQASITELESKLKKERDSVADLLDEKQLLEDEKADLARKVKAASDDLGEYKKDVTDLVSPPLQIH